MVNHGCCFLSFGFTIIINAAFTVKSAQFTKQSEEDNVFVGRHFDKEGHYNGRQRFNNTTGIPYRHIRLPKDIIPVSYKLHLHPEFTTSSLSNFTGKVEIMMECKTATSYVILHVKKLKIKRRVLTALDNRKIEIKRAINSVKYQQYILETGSALRQGERYLLTMEFEGELSAKSAGFYKSSYKTKTGERRYLATTQFEATHARAAFPCFDEPGLKAAFSISLTHHPAYTALSNMPVESRDLMEDGLVQSRFRETVKMSTYLVAFVVCDFKHSERITKTGKLVRVWSRPDAIKRTVFALEVADHTLSYYEDFFSISYPLPKLDLIAIPDMGGAMENWGLITFSESALLYDATSSGYADQLRVAMVIDHELAHQWFGNLVTMEWWNDLWLNEGFAVFVEYIGTDHFAKKWKRLDQFMIDTLEGALDADSLRNTHPVSTRVNDPVQISEIVDVISYHKGSSIIRMLRSFVGEHKFRQGLKVYLKSHAFTNSQARDLWDAFSKVCGNLEVAKIMSGWVEQKGYPVITLHTNTAQMRGKGRRIEISQKMFLRQTQTVREKQEDAKDSPSWYVPIEYITQQSALAERRTIWLNKTTTTHLDIPDLRGWIKANAGQSGFYRVNYDPENWDLLAKQLKTNHKVMTALDRSGLMDDAFNLARAGQLPIATALDVTSYLQKEKEHVPWATVIKPFSYIGQMLCRHDDIYRLYQPYILKRLKALEKYLGWQDKGDMSQRFLRGLMLTNLCSYGETNCVKTAKSLFKIWMKNESIPVEPYIRKTVYRTAVVFGGRKEWKFLLQKHQDSRDATEREKIIYALSATSDGSLLTKLLNRTLNSTTRIHDMVMTIVAVAGSPDGRSLVLDFLINRLPDIVERTGREGRELRVILAKTTEYINDLYHLGKVKTLFAKYSRLIPSSSSTRSKVMENIENNIAWLNINANGVKQWLIKEMKHLPNKPYLDYLASPCPRI